MARARSILKLSALALALVVAGYVAWVVVINSDGRRMSAPAPEVAVQQRVPEPIRAAAVPRTPTPVADRQDIETLITKRLTVPVSGVGPTQLVDTFAQARDEGARPHDAIDILVPRGTPVVAVEDGRIAKLFTSKPGGLTIYQFDPTERFAYYYAHLDRYADGIAEGQIVKRGTLIGFVGFTGNAIESAPHLHFAIFRLGPEKRWWEGVALNPYQPLGGTTVASGPLSSP